MTRLLLSVGRKRCPFRCAYCFTDFSQYERPLSIGDVERDPALLADVDVVYPACDVDLFALKRWHELLDRAVKLGPSISLSTKACLSADAIAKLRMASDELAARGRLLKVAVSFSTRSRVQELEPRAPSYEQRLATLEQIAAAGIPTALVLRPLLVDVLPSEYASIVDDARHFVVCVLTGPEHMDDDAHHARHRVEAPHAQPEERAVTWAVGAPEWRHRAAFPQEAAIQRMATRHGLRVFDSDMHLMAELSRLAKSASISQAA